MAVNMKSMIAETFMALSKTKDVDKITVMDLVKACHISRQTFYYHFQDILEVIEWSMQQAFQEILTRKMDTDAPEKTICIFIESSSEAAALLKKLLHSKRREQIETILVNTVRSYLQELINRQESKPNLPLADAKVILDFCTYGIVGLLLENCGKKSLDKERIAHQMVRFISKGIEILIEQEANHQLISRPLTTVRTVLYTAVP